MNFNDYVGTLPYHSRKENPEGYEAYYKELRDIEAKFRHDLNEDLEIVGHPKADLLFAKAWELGHSCGYSEVYNYALDLVDLIK